MHVIEKVLTPEEVALLRGIAGRSRFVSGTGSAAGAARQVKNNEQLEMSREDEQVFGRTVVTALKRSSLFSRHALPLEICSPMINRYGVGMTYGAHYDSPFMPAANGQKIRTDLSATLFLSDPGDCEGGELCFDYLGAEHRLKLPAGDMVLYPSGTLHRVIPVTRGARMSVVFWVQSMVRDHEKRDLIAKVDGVVAKLAESAPGSEELRELSGVVTNLLRMWAEV